MTRRFALPALIAASALLLSSCGTSDDAEQETGDGAEEQAGEVVFTHPSIDDLTITFEEQPETLVMDCYAYSSLHDYGVEPVALFGYECDSPFVMGDIDISGIEKIGEDGEINVEKLAQLAPDAIIGNGDADGWSWFDDDVNAQLTRVASFIPLPSGEDIDARIADTREIAAFLGGDVESDAIVQADEDYAAAKEAFSAAVEGKDLNFLLASPDKEMLYTGVGFGQANLLEELGATIVGAEPPAEGNPWGQVAWEDASSYAADIILVESYSDDYAFTAELWEALPAVKAEQIGSWSSKGAMTARTYADWLNDVTALVEASEKLS